MRRLFNRLRAWLIHKLGGYTADECIATPDQIERLSNIMRYSREGTLYRRDNALNWERHNSVKQIIRKIEKYVHIDEHIDWDTDELVIRVWLDVIKE